MTHFTVILLCGFVCSGSLQNPNNINGYQLQQSLNILRPVEERNGLSSNQNYQEYIQISEQRKTSVKPCLQIQPDTHLDQPTSNQILSPPNRRSYSKDIVYTPSAPNKLVTIQPQISQEEDQLERKNAINLEKNVWTPELINYSHDLSGNKPPLTGYYEKLNDDNIVTEPLLKQERTADKNYDLRPNTNHLINPVPSVIELLKLPTNVQCTDKTKFESINNPSRRFLISNDNVPSAERPANENNFDISSNGLDDLSRTYTDPEILIPKLSSISSDSKNLRKSSKNSNANFPDSLNSVVSPDSSESLRMGILDKLNDPAQGRNISNIKLTKLMLMNYDKICYACSSANNPTCLSPDRRTTVKYCRKGVNACVTKTYETGSTLTLIRDCGKTCDDFAAHSLGLKYKSCSICQSDLCNSAGSNNINYLLLTIPSIVLLVLVKSQI